MTDTTNPFPIDSVLAAVRDAVKPYPPATLFELADEGYGSLWEVLIACIISVRTLEQETLAVSRRLFARARNAAELLALSDANLLLLLEGSTFPETKLRNLKEIARRTVEEFGGTLPADYETLLSLPGVGPKCTNLALGIACGRAEHVPVDTHVHRVCNRWGYIQAKTPEKTMAALDAVLPVKYRVEINRMLVPFGKYLCTGGAIPPRCSTCPVAAQCARVGVTQSR